MAKHWALILLLSYLFLLTAVSLIDIGKLPSLGSTFDDKIYHVSTHALLTGLCFNYFKRTVITKPILISALVPVCYGIIIEWLQGVTTELRTPDINDVMANILGMIFAVVLIIIIKNVKLK